nr:tyrosine-type recombinase/integrase [Micromonospora sp. DSM 115978]
MPESAMATPTDMIRSHLTWMAAGPYADTTRDDARKILARLHRDLPAGIHQALPEELADWLARPGWSAQTRATYHKHIVRFYRWAASGRDPWLSYDPSAELGRPVALPGLPRPAPDHLVDVALFRLPHPWTLVARLTALAGLRPCEVAALVRADVTERCITIRGKGGKTRSVPTHPLIWQLIEPMPDGPIVTRADGQPAYPLYVTRWGAHHLRAAGCDITLYRLRHWFGTELQSRHRDLRVTQELMGHASPVTTMGYTQVTDDRKRQAVSTLPYGGGTAAGPAPSSPPADSAPPPPSPAAHPPPTPPAAPDPGADDPGRRPPPGPRGPR